MRKLRSSPVEVPELFQLRGEPGWAELFLERVAGALCGADRGTALLIEVRWRSTEAAVRMFPFGPELAHQMRSSALEFPVTLVPVSAFEPWSPPPGTTERWFVVDESRDSEQVVPHRPTPMRATRPVESGRYPFVDGGTPLPCAGELWAATQVHWVANGSGKLLHHERWRFAGTSSELGEAVGRVNDAVCRRRVDAGTKGARLTEILASRRQLREWRDGSLRRWTPRSLVTVTPLVAARLLFLPRPPRTEPEPTWLEHTVVLGASGSGKTSYLASTARRAIARGRTVLLLDAHGDLAPAVLAGLSPSEAERVVAVDAGTSDGPPPGLSVFGPTPASERPVAVAHLVAALRRLTPDGIELYWGFRLERLYETFLRIVQQEGGELRDLWELLTDRRRREAARLSVALPDDARFLEELEAIVKRQPDFLWPAAARIAKVAMSPVLTALLAPRGDSLPVDRLVAEGRSILWRLPIGTLGPEATTFAATLLLTRLYLGLVRESQASPPSGVLRALCVVDEAHLFPPRLLTEMISEGRKFGVGVLVSTQYPERLAPELRHAVAGAAATLLLFRVPWSSAAGTGAWAGLSREESEGLLPALPTGWMLRVESGSTVGRHLEVAPVPPPWNVEAWSTRVRRSREEFGTEEEVRDEPLPDERRVEEALLLGLVAAEARGGAADLPFLLRWAETLPGEPVDPAGVHLVLPRLVARGWLRQVGERFELTAGGAEAVGLTVHTGARPESAEHRALLLEAFRIFARHGERLEIVRQGRFDARLPDGRARVLPSHLARIPPAALLSFLERRRRDWVWRAFGGRDVFVEAEVSGALRRERIRRDWEKARDAGAHLLCLVADPQRARRVKATLDSFGVSRQRASVWTLRGARIDAGSETSPRAS